jgi:hypothetical protein
MSKTKPQRGPQLKHAAKAARPRTPAGAPYEFTIEEHLRVQQQIEARAYRLWRAHLDAAGNVFNHWLKAEFDVLTEFVKNRTAGLQPNQPQYKEEC